MNATIQEKISALNALNVTLQQVANFKDLKGEFNYKHQENVNQLLENVRRLSAEIVNHEDTVVAMTVPVPAPRPSPALTEDVPF